MHIQEQPYPTPDSATESRAPDGPALLDQYVASGVKHCPFCKGKNLRVGPVEATDTIGWSEVVCGDCWHTWKEVWVLVDLVEATDQRLEPISLPQ
jgi:hypothetical protein